MTVAAIAPSDQHSAVARAAMVDSQLRTNDVTEPALVAALREVPREDFLPAALHAAAYIDRSLPLADGRALNPALSTARLIADARVEPGFSVLLIGAATGYAAAVLDKLGARVTAVEEHGELLAIARSALAGTGATVVEASLAVGTADGAPYDILIVDGAVEALPTALLALLKPGARIACGLKAGGVTRLARAVATGDGQPVRPVPFADLECVPLPGFASPPRFTF